MGPRDVHCYWVGHCFQAILVAMQGQYIKYICFKNIKMVNNFRVFYSSNPAFKTDFVNIYFWNDIIKNFQTSRWGKGINQEVGINTYTLLYIKQIINKIVLYSTGDSTQYSVMSYMGKESTKEWACVYVQLIYFVVQQKLTQHCKLTILQ